MGGVSEDEDNKGGAFLLFNSILGEDCSLTEPLLKDELEAPLMDSLSAGVSLNFESEFYI